MARTKEYAFSTVLDMPYLEVMQAVKARKLIHG
jgi:hypothetical protein